MNYFKYETVDKKELLIQENFINILMELDSLIFDCDGVLLNTSKSFDQAIKYTIDYLFLNIFELQKPTKPFVTNEDIITLRNTGGLGNDWDLSFIIILYYFSTILLKFQNSSKNKELIIQTIENLKTKFNTLQERIDQLKIFSNLFQRLEISADDLTITKEEGPYTLFNLTKQMDASGIKSGGNVLLKWLDSNYKEIHKLWDKIEGLFGYDLPHLENLTKMVFEEIYLGSDGFKKIYNSKPLFFFGPGLIENEF